MTEAVVAPHACPECPGGSGVLTSWDGGPVERCDACQRYEGDLDAALALAKTRGLGERVFYSTDPDDPDDPDHGDVREFTGTYDAETLIAEGTCPWLQKL